MFLVEKVKVTEIAKGDLVRSRDIKNKVDRYREVLQLINPTVNDQVEISADNFSICTSSTHPMAVVKDNEEQYIETKDIKIGDVIITTNGYKKVTDIKKGKFYSEDFIDFTIDEDNNYYAGNDQDHLILAHNSATLYYPIWHLDFEDLIVLKNNKGIDETRVRDLDYGVQLNKLFYERLINGEDITLMSPHDVPEMYDAFFNDQEKFKELYEKAERSHIRKKKIPAVDVIRTLMQERKDTGRIYIQNVDHANTHSSFKEDIAPIHMSNLCCVTKDTKVSALIDGEINDDITVEELVKLTDSEIYVLSKNLDNNNIEYARVIAAAQTRKNAELLLIEDEETGIKIKCTPDHLIYTKNRGYVRADQLTENDILDIYI